VILVHAGAARLLAEKDPARSREALATIETLARETLGEIDQLVGALRDDEDQAQSPIGLAALDALVKRHRDAGLEVDLEVSGERRALPPATDAGPPHPPRGPQNALRHGAGRADVTLAYDDDELEIQVDNPARATVVAEGGHGIVGMRERASLLGGSVEYGTTNGLFRVRARLPCGAGDQR
jgi:signal transduction histidine kinase